MPADKRKTVQPSNIIDQHPAEPQPQPHRRQNCSGAEMTRRYIALTIIALIAASAISSIWTPAAITILERLLPSLTLMCGYYYGQVQN